MEIELYRRTPIQRRRLKMKNSYKNFEITIVDDATHLALSFDASAEEKDLIFHPIERTAIS